MADAPVASRDELAAPTVPVALGTADANEHRRR
jgi:hypothetical protein